MAVKKAKRKKLSDYIEDTITLQIWQHDDMIHISAKPTLAWKVYWAYINSRKKVK